MLKYFRKRAASWGIKIIMGLIILAFALWGTGRIGSKRETVVAEVGKYAITIGEFDRTFRQTLEGLQRMTGRALEREEVRRLGVASSVLSNLINGHLLYLEAQRWGIRGSTQELREAIFGSPLFQRGGRFDRELYLSFLRRQGLSPSEFEENLSRALLRSRVQRAIEAMPFFGREEAEGILSKVSERLVFEAIKVEAKALKGEIEVREEELIRYLSEHQEEFRIPEKVKIAYVRCLPQEVLEEVSVDPKEAEHYYRRHPEEFSIPERVRLGHIFLKDREKAQEVMGKLQKGEDFSSLAKRFSEDPLTKQKGGDLGYIPLGDLAEDLSEAISRMEKGEVKLFEGRGGFHIVKLLDRKPAKLLPFGEVKDRIVEKLRWQKAEDLCAMKMADFAYHAKKGDFEEYAKQMGLEVHIVGPLSRADEIKGLGRCPKLLGVAFSLTPGEISPMVEDGGRFFVLKLLERIPSRIPSLEEVREEVRRRVVQQKAILRARAIAQEILQRWREGREPTELMRRYALGKETVGPISRAEVARYWSEELALLTPSQPVAPVPFEIQGRVFALRLKEVEERKGPNAEGFALALEKIWQRQILSNWLNKRMEEEGVRLNPKLLEPYGFQQEG